IRPSASISAGLTICALASLASMRPMRPSRKPCRSRAASYSAFSDKSPWERASAIAVITAGRSTVFSRCNSTRSFSAPALVNGTFFISKSLLQRVAETPRTHSGFEMARPAVSLVSLRLLCGSALLESLQSPQQRLRRVRYQLAHALQTEGGGASAGDRGVGGHLVGKRGAADDVAVLDG